MTMNRKNVLPVLLALAIGMLIGRVVLSRLGRSDGSLVDAAYVARTDQGGTTAVQAGPAARGISADLRDELRTASRQLHELDRRLSALERDRGALNGVESGASSDIVALRQDIRSIQDEQRKQRGDIDALRDMARR